MENYANQRKEVRAKKSLLVSIGKNGYENMGITANLSRGGMLITTVDQLPELSEMSILVGVEDNTITLKGEVVWCNDSFGPTDDDTQYGSGIKITESNSQYLDYIDKILKQILSPVTEQSV